MISSIIGASGGISGWILAWFYWKKFKRKIKVIPLHSWYGKFKELYIDNKGDFKIAEIVEGKKDENKILTEINLLIVNDGEISISLTDAIAMAKYSKDKLPTLGYTQAVFDTYPLNANYVLPFIVKPHEAKRLQLFYEFKNINTDFLERMGIARFGGWLGGRVPIVIADEREKDKMWNILPLQVFLLLSIDAEDTENVYVPVFPENYEAKQKLTTLDVIQIEETKRKFWEEQNK
ncbi:MAG TPA: hypothetical protein ENI33_09065 [Thermoplasmatales archaeon]|nr:hypothetical protein [Thermoplasmatales archaeon]